MPGEETFGGGQPHRPEQEARNAFPGFEKTLSVPLWPLTTTCLDPMSGSGVRARPAGPMSHMLRDAHIPETGGNARHAAFLFSLKKCKSPASLYRSAFGANSRKWRSRWGSHAAAQGGLPRFRLHPFPPLREDREEKMRPRASGLRFSHL